MTPEERLKLADALADAVTAAGWTGWTEDAISRVQDAQLAYREAASAVGEGR